MVTWEQRFMNGDPKYNASQNLPDFDYAEYAKSMGLEGITVRKADEVASALDQALAYTKPVVLNVYVDPSVPPLPPHITFEQAQKFLSFMFKGDDDLWDVIRQTWKNILQEYLPVKK